MADQEMSVEQFEQYRLAADDAARAEYQNAQLRGEGEDRAQKAAEFAWRKKMDEAGLTGYYDGQATMPTQQYWANTFGTWSGRRWPQTLSPAQAWQQAYNRRSNTPCYSAPPPTAARRLRPLSTAYTQWRGRSRRRALSRLSSIQPRRATAVAEPAPRTTDCPGPQSGTTPAIAHLTAAAMGQYIPGGGATTGVSPEAASLQGLQQQIQGTGGGTNTMGEDQAQGGMGNLPAPNQIAPQAWKNLAPSQQQMLLGAYEAQGWHKGREALRSQSLPKYASNAPVLGTWRPEQLRWITSA